MEYSNFVKPEKLVKSSVGEYYEQNMQFFIDVAKRVHDYFADTNDDRGVDDQTAHSLYKGILPLGARPLALGMPVMEDPAQDKPIERLAHQICVGYAPQRDVSRTIVIKNDSGFLKEYMLANLLYPWVMQPISQLRLLVPSLDPTTFDSIIAGYQKDYKTGKAPTAFDTVRAFNYEFLSDYLAYTSFYEGIYSRDNHPSQLMTEPIIIGQYWTPFFGVYNHDLYKEHIKDDKLLLAVEECFTRSKKLYIEIIKTGFTQEAQYATLRSMTGRFLLSSDLSTLLRLIHPNTIKTYSPSALALVEDIRQDLRTNSIVNRILETEKTNS